MDPPGRVLVWVVSAAEDHAPPGLQVACRYLSTILGNARVRKYLHAHHADLVKELEQITTDVTGEQVPS